MKLELCHTISTETVTIDFPDMFAKDLEHVVIINGGEAYQIKSTIPDEVKHRNQLRQNFEDTAFEDLRKTYYRDLDENADPDEFEKDFTSKCRDLIYVDDHYKELESILTDEILHTLCIHFAIYAVTKNREEQFKAKNDAQKKDRCYAKDYSKRLIDMFNSLSFSDPGSMMKFSQDLNLLEQFMQRDERRHAGHDKIFTGIKATITMLANAFITTEGEKDINIVKAFEKVANGESNPDRDKLIKKIKETINTTTSYYRSYINSINSTEADVATIDKDICLSYLGVARGLVASFINDTDNFLNKSDTKDAEKVATYRKVYKKQVEKFLMFFEDLIAAFDDVTDNKTPFSNFAIKLNELWTLITTAKNSDSETWPTDLARTLYDSYNDTFKDVPNDLRTHQKSN